MSLKSFILGIALFCWIPLSFGHNEDILLEMIKQLADRVKELENPSLPTSQWDTGSLFVGGATRIERAKISADGHDLYHEGKTEDNGNFAVCTGKDILYGPFEISASLSYVYGWACIGFAKLEGFDAQNRYIRHRLGNPIQDQFFRIDNNSSNNLLTISYADSTGTAQEAKRISPGYASGIFRICRNYVGTVSVYHNEDLLYVHPEKILGSVKSFAMVQGDPTQQATTCKVSNFKVLRLPQLYERMEASWKNQALLSLPNLKLWLKADSIPLGNEALIDQWSDSSGRGNHVSSIGDKRPQYIASSNINGKRAVRFKRSNDQELRCPPKDDFNFTEATIFFVSNSCVHTVYSIAKENTEMNEVFSFIDNTVYRIHSSNCHLQHQDRSDKPCIRTAVMGKKANDIAYYVNSVASTQEKKFPNFDYEFQSVRRYLVLGNEGLAGNLDRAFEGDIAEVLIYAGKLNDQDRAIVERYLSIKYEIPLK